MATAGRSIVAARPARSTTPPTRYVAVAIFPCIIGLSPAARRLEVGTDRLLLLLVLHLAGAWQAPGTFLGFILRVRQRGVAASAVRASAGRNPAS